MLRKHIFIPGNIPSARKYLFGVRRLLFECADVYIPALNIFMLAREHFGIPTEIYSLHENIFQPRKYLPSPRKLLYFLRRFSVLSFFKFLGLPDCLDYENDPLLATSAL